ncbi:MAG TPA: hypothetical protein VHA52_07265, partial [Candidatus Babeliaceae bacterium]|nr:hypothetical protein [Candidatus Babeliaceae bacterium]
RFKASSNDTDLAYFNSTMVRLRVFLSTDLMRELRYFNSTMVRLRAVILTIKKSLFSRLCKDISLFFSVKKSSMSDNTINAVHRRPLFIVDNE